MTAFHGEQLPDLLANRAQYQRRLERILPEDVVGTSRGCNWGAAATAYVMMYVGSVGGIRPIRPSTVTWMSDTIIAVQTPEFRHGYYVASMKSQRALAAHLADHGIGRGEPWYSADTREQVRKHALYTFRDSGALRLTPGVDTNASRARYSLDASFAELLNPNLDGEELDGRIRDWQDEHLSMQGRLRAQRERERASGEGQLVVNLPGGGTRNLAGGASSLILKAVIEEFALQRLSDPHVLFISEPSQQVDLLDKATLDRIGLAVDAQRLLPDCLLVDLDPLRDEFWLVEIVHSDGPVTEQRRAAFLEWMGDRLEEDQYRFLTAFESRASSQSKNALPVLARNSYAWFRSEPDGLLSWEDLAPHGPPIAGNLHRRLG